MKEFGSETFRTLATKRAQLLTYENNPEEMYYEVLCDLSFHKFGALDSILYTETKDQLVPTSDFLNVYV
jgi:hypothetical protein